MERELKVAQAAEAQKLERIRMAIATGRLNVRRTVFPSPMT